MQAIVSHKCVGCDKYKAERELERVTVGDEMFYACDTCADAYEGPGRGEGIHEDGRALAVVLEYLAGISMEDHMLADESGYAGQFGEHILVVDDRGFVDVRTFKDAAAATREMNSYEDNGMGASEDDAYINYSNRGLEVSFAGEYVGTFPRLSRAKAKVSLLMREQGYFPNVWLTGEHGPTIRRINVW